jgi:hypothetical protein
MPLSARTDRVEVERVGVTVDVADFSAERTGRIAFRSRSEGIDGRLAIQVRTFAETRSGGRIAPAYWHMSTGFGRSGANAIWKGWRGPPLPTDPEEEMRALEEYRLQLHDIEDAINQMLGRDPEQTSPPRLSWGPLVSALHDEGIRISEGELIDLPFVFEFSEELLAEIRTNDDNKA